MKVRFLRLAAVTSAVAGLVLGGTLAGAAAQSKPAAAGSLKVAVLLSTGLKDTGYGRAAYSGILKVQKDFGIKAATADLIKPADFANAMTSYASRGYDLVILDGVEFQDAAKQVSAKFPKTWFVVVNGFLAGKPNLAAVDFEWEQAGFLAGIVAGLATKSNKVGNIGGIKIPPIEGLFFGFKQGLAVVNPKAAVTVSYVGSFTDPGKAKTVADAQISQGVDVIWAIADTANTGIFQAVQEKGIKAIGYGTDESSFAPKNIVSTTLVGYGTVIYGIVKLARAGKLQPTVYVEGFKQGVLGLAPFHGLLSAKDAAKATSLAKQAKAGKLKIEKMGQ